MSYERLAQRLLLPDLHLVKEVIKDGTKLIIVIRFLNLKFAQNAPQNVQPFMIM